MQHEGGNAGHAKPQQRQLNSLNIAASSPLGHAMTARQLTRQHTSPRNNKATGFGNSRHDGHALGAADADGATTQSTALGHSHSMTWTWRQSARTNNQPGLPTTNTIMASTKKESEGVEYRERTP